MAEFVQVGDAVYKQREPLGVLGLSFITLGIYFLYWYYQVNVELKRYQRDDSMSPTRSLMALIFGWMIVFPPFLAMYNTGKHVQQVEQARGTQPQLEPVLTIVFLVLANIVNGPYIQAHLNSIWARSSGLGIDAAGALPPPPPPLPA